MAPPMYSSIDMLPAAISLAAPLMRLVVNEQLQGHTASATHSAAEH